MSFGILTAICYLYPNIILGAFAILLLGISIWIASKQKGTKE